MPAIIAGASRAAWIPTVQDADIRPEERRLGVLERDRRAQPARGSIKYVATAMSQLYLHR